MREAGELKRAAARAALDEVESGMTLGLGTGSTAGAFVRLLGEAQRSGELRDLRAVCTSRETERLARDENIVLARLEELAPLDLAVDGADEIDAQLRMIKGHGGALLREKIVEQSSKRFLVIADESKIVERLGATKRLPVEIVTFGAKRMLDRLRDRGLDPKPRLVGGDWYVTDEGHHIVDVIVPEARDIAGLVDDLRTIAGVVDTGFFPDEATEAIIAGSDGMRRLAR